MMVIFTSRSEKKAIYTVRRILDSFADRIGNDTWKTVITQEGLLTVQALLRRTATKSTAVACHWIRSRSHSELVWIVGKRDMFNEGYYVSQELLCISGGTPCGECGSLAEGHKKMVWPIIK